jgi:hypothetical protein
VDLLTKDIVGQFGVDISPEETQGGSALDKDLYDRQYDDSNKRHRNLLSKLNHWFVIVSHPFSLVIIFMVVFITFLVTRYIGVGTNGQGKVVSKISGDAGTALSYLGTIIVTSVFTKFLERKKK